ncbi:MAG: hypothetical protein OXP75_06730 [Rhodospirillales bacterium]|nr:hypothetical protein [Rhodospirillales bacterium]
MSEASDRIAAKHDYTATTPSTAGDEDDGALPTGSDSVCIRNRESETDEEAAGHSARVGSSNHSAGRGENPHEPSSGRSDGSNNATESLLKRDQQKCSYRLSKSEYLRHASKRSGRKPLALALESLRLARGPGRMTVPEYVQFGLDDPALSDAERRRFLTETLHWPIVHRCCDMTWMATVEDTWLCTRILEQSGLPTPRTLAVIDRTKRTYPGTRTIRTASELRDFLCAHVSDDTPVFGKENRGIMGFGVFLVLEADRERLHLEGEGWFSYQDFLDELVGDTAYILQPVERNHPFFERFTNHLATVRVGVFHTREGPKILFTVLKIPGTSNLSDHFWRKGNLACDVDPSTGVIRRARSKDPLGTTDYIDHPETGARLIDETLPHWADLRDLALKCSENFAPIRYQSMDVAITPNGPLLIEINVGGAFNLPQLASGRGFLTDEVMEFFDDCGVRLKRSHKLKN